MTNTEIHNLANELTEQEVLNIVKGWENDADNKSLDAYNSLVKLGDSMQLACATVIADKTKENDTDLYYKGYCI